MRNSNHFNHRLTGGFVTFFLAMTVSAAAMAQDQASGQGAGNSVELKAGVVLDTNKDRLFYTTREGGIEAVDIATGDSLWITDAAEKPVAASPGRLIAHSSSPTPGTLPIAFINPGDGRIIMQREARLPEQVKVSVDEKLSYRFELKSNGNQNPGRLNWQYREQIVQGMNAENPPEPINYSGEISVNSQSGDIDVLAPSATAPALALADVELPSANRSQSRRFRSADDAYVLVSEALPPENGQLRYRWQIEDATGSSLGEIENRVSYSPFSVSGNVLVFINTAQTIRANRFQSNPGGTVHGFDLQTGEEIWQRDLRNLKYDGPLPH